MNKVLISPLAMRSFFKSFGAGPRGLMRVPARHTEPHDKERHFHSVSLTPRTATRFTEDIVEPLLREMQEWSASISSKRGSYPVGDTLIPYRFQLDAAKNYKSVELNPGRDDLLRIEQEGADRNVFITFQRGFRHVPEEKGLHGPQNTCGLTRRCVAIRNGWDIRTTRVDLEFFADSAEQTMARPGLFSLAQSLGFEPLSWLGEDRGAHAIFPAVAYELAKKVYAAGQFRKEDLGELWLHDPANKLNVAFAESSVAASPHELSIKTYHKIADSAEGDITLFSADGMRESDNPLFDVSIIDNGIRLSVYWGQEQAHTENLQLVPDLVRLWKIAAAASLLRPEEALAMPDD